MVHSCLRLEFTSLITTRYVVCYLMYIKQRRISSKIMLFQHPCSIAFNYPRAIQLEYSFYCHQVGDPNYETQRFQSLCKCRDRFELWVLTDLNKTKYCRLISSRNGRPNSQSVSRRYNANWGSYMSSRKGIIYIQLDVRGSKGQSTEDLYKQLGDIEVEDQITVIK